MQSRCLGFIEVFDFRPWFPHFQVLVLGKNVIVGASLVFCVQVLLVSRGKSLQWLLTRILGSSYLEAPLYIND